ncbi:MAG TPA: hypothetical protein VMM15_18945 [Bradyrhizobium sp.]|nr:hypothetical protein [Bradyrhizobium sp.]
MRSLEEIVLEVKDASWDVATVHPGRCPMGSFSDAGDPMIGKASTDRYKASGDGLTLEEADQSGRMDEIVAPENMVGCGVGRS